MGTGKRRLIGEVRQSAIRMLREGVSPAIVAKIIKMDSEAIRRLGLREGLIKRKMHRVGDENRFSGLTKRERTSVLMRVNRGDSIRKIARDMGKERKVIKNFLRIARKTLEQGGETE